MSETPQKELALGVVFSILPIPFVALRFYTRRRCRLELGWDDWLIVIALVRLLAVASRQFLLRYSS